MNQIVYGTGTGVDSSANLTFDGSSLNLTGGRTIGTLTTRVLTGYFGGITIGTLTGVDANFGVEGIIKQSTIGGGR